MTNQINPGQMRFLDNYLPLLPAAPYKVSVTQTLQASTQSDPTAINVAQTLEQEFYVDGPRFALQPDEVHTQFPPPNAQGVFETALPQIVLSHRGLPWERAIWEGAPQVPWLALVVLDDTDIMAPNTGSAAGAQVAGAGATTIPVSDLFDAAPADVLLPAIAPSPYQDPQEQVQVVDLTPDGFRTAVPTQDVARWLASVREVDLGHKSAGGAQDTTSLTAEQGMPDWARWYSVITAARFPAAPETRLDTRTQAVHLVSLEGFTDYLRTDNPVALPGDVSRIRMVSLCSWTFASLPEAGQDFSQLMAGLAPVAGETLAFALPQKAPGSDVEANAADIASAALTAGYVPRTYSTRQGEETYAWYRGPFVPALPAALPVLAQSPTNSAQLAVYNPDTGLFDMSYATAFETGRLLALSNGAFCDALMRWQNRGLRLVSLMAERAANAGLDLATLNPEQINALATQPKAARTVLDYLTNGGLDALNQTFQHPQSDAEPAEQVARAAPELTPDTLAQTMAVDPVQLWLRLWAHNLSGPVLSFLSKLWLFEPVPYNTLVPDNALLPIESFRAFYVDRNWQIALIQGALAIGITGSREHAFQQILRSALLEQIEAAALARRNKLLGIVGSPDAPSGQMSGCLLRSAAVSGWPGLEIKAFHGGATTPIGGDHRDIDTSRTAPLSSARLTRLGPQVMLGLFNGLADWMEIDEPREGLHFGVESENRVYLRALDGDNVGQELGDDQYVTAPIDTTTRVLDVVTLANQLQTALGASTFGPGDFALEMVQVPESMVFTTSGAKGTAT